jgi:hypothetical protein
MLITSGARGGAFCHTLQVVYGGNREWGTGNGEKPRGKPTGFGIRGPGFGKRPFPVRHAERGVDKIGKGGGLGNGGNGESGTGIREWGTGRQVTK